MAATHRFLLSSLLLCFLIEASYGAEKVVPLFSQLKSTLDVTTKPSKSGVLDAGVDKVTITWKLSTAAPVGSEAAYKTATVKLCYGPVSQVDRPWRRTLDEISKDKTCTHKIVARPYEKSLQTLDWTVERNVPTAAYFVRVYVEDAQGHEVAFGQSTDTNKTTNLFQVQAISGRHASLDIASICFSVFSVVSLFVFFYNEKRKAKLEQQK